ncbi:E3 ubiquitin-protein ligase UPL3 [Capsicum chinense]|nr:E3 ubiquitin-protein ligase UPL3 [Capsicum chinense]
MGYMEFALDSAAKPPIQVYRKDWSISKEKEYEVRVRDRDAEWSLGLNIDSGGGAGGEDDDNDSEGGVGILHQNLTSASSALQGLVRKLGAGLDDLLLSSAMESASSSHQNGRLKKILAGLRADGEEGKQVEALMQLCEMFSIGTEDFLSTFFVDSFVLMLLAARALTHLVDVLPSSCVAVVHYGAVSCFVARLLTIEYMDLAEQSFQTLKKISQEHPTACLRAGALMAVLLISILFHWSSEKLDELCNHGLVTQAASSSQPITLVVDKPHSARQPTQLLSTCAGGSPLGAKLYCCLFFDGYGYHGRSFEQTYRFYPASFIEKPQIENGDKIIMPPSALDRLASLHIDYPMLFEL